MFYTLFECSQGKTNNEFLCCINIVRYLLWQKKANRYDPTKSCLPIINHRIWLSPPEPSKSTKVAHTFTTINALSL